MMEAGVGVYGLVAFAVLAVLILLAAGVSWVWSRAFRAALPPPAPSKAEADGRDLLELVQAQADKDKQEVSNAKGNGLRGLFIRRMFRRPK